MYVFIPVRHIACIVLYIPVFEYLCKVVCMRSIRSVTLACTCYNSIIFVIKFVINTDLFLSYEELRD